MQPLKVPLTYDQQIEHLRITHGLIIDDFNEAKRILSLVNYYRFTAYGLSFLNRKTDKYLQGTTIEEIYALYRFDAHLRHALMPCIEYIEIQLRTRVAYLLAMKYGAESYRDAANFCSHIIKRTGRDAHEVFIDRCNQETEKQGKNLVVAHHKQTYGGHFPIWVMTELIPFGHLLSLFTILRADDKKTVSVLYCEPVKYLESWFPALVEIRNTCAHYGRIYNAKLNSTPMLHKEYQPYRSNKIFPALLAMRNLLRGTSEWHTFHATLIPLVHDNRYIKLECIGFPIEWEDLLSPIM